MLFTNIAASLALFVFSKFPLESRRTTHVSVQSEKLLPFEKYEDLIQWLKSNGSEINEKITLKASSSGVGFGAFVTDVVEADEMLFTVPRKTCVTLENALDDPEAGTTFKKLIEKAGPGGKTVAMAGFIAKERLKCLEDARNNKDVASTTKFGPYFATLPWERGVNNQEHILFWKEDDIERLLKGSMCYQEAIDLRAEVDLAIKVLDSIIGKSVRLYRGETVSDGPRWPWEAKPEPQGIPEGLPEAVKGSFVCLLTRAFEDGDDDNEKLVPLLDMLQHSDEPNVSHAMKKVDGTVEVRAKRALQAGEELLNQYRSELEESMPYHRFFTRFGFVPGIVEPMENLLADKSSIFFAQKAEV